MPEIEIARPFRGHIVPRDLLLSEGTLFFSIQIQRFNLYQDGFFFKVADDHFTFTFKVQNRSLILERNQATCVLTVDDLPDNLQKLTVTAVWNTDELRLHCGHTHDIKQEQVATAPSAPPTSLIRWARKQDLLPTLEYPSEEEFRQRVYSSLDSIQPKISEIGAYNPFWDIQYEGQSIKARRPKKETDIHPTIHSMLSDQMLMASIEVIPEYQTGVGNLDFMFQGTVKNYGIARLCAEFKPAHSTDIFRGLEVQLPLYMQNKSTQYGAYCILGFKGDWFDEPKSVSLEELFHQLQLTKLRLKSPTIEGIRIFMYDLSKPTSASKQ